MVQKLWLKHLCQLDSLAKRCQTIDVKASLNPTLIMAQGLKFDLCVITQLTLSNKSASAQTSARAALQFLTRLGKQHALTHLSYIMRAAHCLDRSSTCRVLRAQKCSLVRIESSVPDIWECLDQAWQPRSRQNETARSLVMVNIWTWPKADTADGWTLGNVEEKLFLLWPQKATFNFYIARLRHMQSYTLCTAWRKDKYKVTHQHF